MANSGTWKKGKPPGPGRKPLHALISQVMKDQDWLNLIEVAKKTATKDRKLRMHALEFLFDRAFGKPTQPMEVTGAEGGPVRVALNLSALSDAELAALDVLLAKAMPVEDPPG